jgi:hypothetical protein
MDATKDEKLASLKSDIEELKSKVKIIEKEETWTDSIEIGFGNPPDDSNKLPEIEKTLEEFYRQLLDNKLVSDYGFVHYAKKMTEFIKQCKDLEKPEALLGQIEDKAKGLEQTINETKAPEGKEGVLREKLRKLVIWAEGNPDLRKALGYWTGLKSTHNQLLNKYFDSLALHDLSKAALAEAIKGNKKNPGIIKLIQDKQSTVKMPEDIKQLLIDLPKDLEELESSESII